MTERVCQGCGAPLPPNRGPGPARKWCSARCRKAQYAGVCVDCGAPTNGSDGRGPNASRRCASCGSRQAVATNAERCRQHRELVERLWAEGLTARQIADRLGWTVKSPGTSICVLRRRGYDLPHRRSPDQLARIRAGSSERMAKARSMLRAAA